MTTGSPLPEAVRTRVVAIAADCLGTLPPEEVPGPLRAVARFTPRRRAKATTPIATHLSADEKFRAVVGAHARLRHPDLAAALDAGEPPAAAEPVEVAAIAWLLQSQGWEALVEHAAAAEANASVAAASAAESAARLREQLDATRATGRAEITRMRTELTAVRGELDRVRAELRREQDRAARAHDAAQDAAVDAKSSGERAAKAARSAENELRRLRARLAEAEQTIDSVRREQREQRSGNDVRLRLLIDAVVGAAQGLARELALPPVTTTPADFVLGASPPSATGRTTWSGAPDDPDFLAELLAVPAVHLVVDGYNVTKTGYGELPLEQQRTRLVAALGGLAARTQAEVTCVFDGAGVGPVSSGGSTRRVRVLFSDPGVTADEVIRRLVAAEPTGRPVVVVSADREVAEGVARPGVTAVPSVSLLRLLGDAGR
jgi:predicted RNA-binding protein with PIN domain